MLIFFHCHKAAGTSVTRAAVASGMKLPEGHRNGNPVDADGKLVAERLEQVYRDTIGQGRAHD